MPTIPTIQNLAAEVLEKCTDSARKMVEAWTQDFVQNARIDGSDLVYHNGRMSMDNIGDKLSRFVVSNYVVMVESVLAQHFERRIPHLAAYLVDEHLNKSAAVLRSTDKHRYPSNNAYLEHVELLLAGPVLTGEIRLSEKVSWDRQFLWMRDMPLPATFKEDLVGKTLGTVIDHPSIPGDLKIVNIDDWKSGEGVCIYPEIKVRPMAALQIYRTNADGVLIAPAHPIH